MRARLAGTVILSMIAFIVVASLVSLGVLWATGGLARGTLIGVICGAVAAFTVSVVGTAIGRRSGEHSGDDHERSRSGHDR
jgi:uncharacterized membrane protein YdjX (TVP38/TMEM64 family)